MQTLVDGCPYQDGPGRRLKRSNAVRVKSENLSVLPSTLRRAISRLKQRQSALTNQQVDIHGDSQEELSLFEQIRRGIQLKPVKLRARMDATGPKKELDDSVANLLVKVLQTRYLAMQYTDDDDDDYDDEDLDFNIDNFKVGPNYRFYHLFEDSTLSKSDYGKINFIMKL